MDAAIFLPYHCPRLSNGNFLRSPCAGKIAEAEERRAKFPQALLGALEHCLNCRGKDLVEREAPVIPPDEKNRTITVSAIEEAIPLDERKSESKLNDIPLTAKEGVMEYTGDIRPEVTMGAQFVGPPQCPKHPQEPQVQCGPDSKRAGQFMGVCKICMAERRLGRKKGKAKEKMTPAVARDIGKGRQTSMKGAVVFKDEAEAERVLGPGKITVVHALDSKATVSPVPPESACKKHPDRLAQIDALGRNMRLCPECLAERGRKSAEKNREQGLTGAPFNIPLNAGKWAELKEWLSREAEENERTLRQEVMYRLKRVMRENKSGQV
jgi:hypothetical protein